MHAYICTLEVKQISKILGYPFEIHYPDRDLQPFRISSSSEITLLVFVIVSSTLAISEMKYSYRGWAGGRGGGKLNAGNTIHKEANSSAVSSIGHRNCHSKPGRTRQSSAAV